MTTPHKKDKEALGKGIRSLLQSIDADLKTTSGELKSSVVEAVTNMLRIPLDQIEANPRQPRHDFDEVALQELAHSIRLHDIIQPVTVSRLPTGKYRLISGERRFRAAKIAELADIPAYVRQADDQQLLELALLENLQREDLNAMEIALSYKRMMEELNYTQEQVAERMGKERSTVANYIRLLKLPPDIQVAVRSNQLSMGHARAILGLPDEPSQLALANKTAAQGFSVRQVERMVQNATEKRETGAEPNEPKADPNIKAAISELESALGTRVRINEKDAQRGKIEIEYYSQEDLHRIYEQIIGQR